MAKTKIEWTESSWNPVTGCTKISEGCRNCYAERMALRLKAMGNPNYCDGFKIRCHEHALEIPLKWKSPKMIFVNSMSDLFHEDIPFDFLQKVFSVMNQTPWHTYQVLTKRAENLARLSDKLNWTPNIWAGVTIESNQHIERLSYLKQVNSAVRFISFEPLLSSVGEVDLNGIDWVIVGGESGPRSRPMDQLWVEEIKEQAELLNIPFFFKQWGGYNKKAAGRELHGRTWDEMPSSSLSLVP